ncbi:alpha/beta fold hydrolase [Nocardioides immobilis]|nr:hypothetical protein [Nocardioides immobilis]
MSPKDREEFQRLAPSARVVSVAGAGHAIQSDQPRALARLLDEFLSADN